MGRKITAFVLLGLGAFLLATGALARFWAAPASAKLPKNVDSTTVLDGHAKKLNPVTGKLESFPVRITNVTKVVPNLMTDKYAVITQGTCVMKSGPDVPACVHSPDSHLIQAINDVVAIDRVSSESVNNVVGLPADNPHMSGLNVKYPFYTQKHDYMVWDSTAGKATLAKYAGTVTRDGLKLYKFDTSINRVPIQITPQIKGTYTLTKTVWVEPVTGAIVDQTQHDVRKLDNGTTALDMQVAYSKQSVANGIKDGKTNSQKLHLLKDVVPMVGFISGGILLVLGLILLALAPGRRRAA